MRYILLFLILLVFGCAVEKRMHRPGFYFKKHVVNDHSKKENNTTNLEITKGSRLKEKGNQKPITSQVEQLKATNQSQKIAFPENGTNEKAKPSTSSLITEEKRLDTNQKNVVVTPKPTDKKRESRAARKEPDETSSGLSIIANVLAVISFVFAIIMVLSIALAFFMSISLILPLMPALLAFMTSGLSLLADLITKSEKYKRPLALIGLISATIFFAFFILVLAGVILI